MEQAYCDAYEGEGWRGANREKVRSTADLDRARLQVRRRLIRPRPNSFLSSCMPPGLPSLAALLLLWCILEVCSWMLCSIAKAMLKPKRP